MEKGFSGLVEGVEKASEFACNTIGHSVARKKRVATGNYDPAYPGWRAKISQCRGTAPLRRGGADHACRSSRVLPSSYVERLSNFGSAGSHAARCRPGDRHHCPADAEAPQECDHPSGAVANGGFGRPCRSLQSVEPRTTCRRRRGASLELEPGHRLAPRKERDGTCRNFGSCGNRQGFAACVRSSGIRVSAASYSTTVVRPRVASYDRNLRKREWGGGADFCAASMGSLVKRALHIAPRSFGGSRPCSSRPYADACSPAQQASPLPPCPSCRKWAAASRAGPQSACGPFSPDVLARVDLRP
jgi:hypothetical protein